MKNIKKFTAAAAAVLLLTAVPLNAYAAIPEKFKKEIDELRAEYEYFKDVLKEFDGELSSEEIYDLVVNSRPSAYFNLRSKNYVTPIHSGKISFSNAFIIPDGDHVPLTWGSAIFCDGRPVAVATISKSDTQTYFGGMIYLGDEISDRLTNGEKFAIVDVDVGAVEGIFYAVDEKNDLIPLKHPTSYAANTPKYYFPKYADIDFEDVSLYNVLSDDMEIAVTVDHDGKDELSEGDTVRFCNSSGEYFVYSGSDKFIVKNVEKDDNGRTVFSISPENKPDKLIKAAGGNKFYTECITGGTGPTYGIFPVSTPEKALTMKENGKAVIKKRTDDTDQQWLIYIEKNDGT